MSLKDLENIKGEIKPRCATCGYQDHFEFNDDYSYIKCTNCGREYFGGKEELLEYNQEAIDEAKEELAIKVKSEIEKELKKAFNKWK